jgi:phosphoglycolate phosphatase-like HAD superfamily hydrolase
VSTPSLSARPALLFDLDGTLVDSVYQHVLAWREALEAEGLVTLTEMRVPWAVATSGSEVTAKGPLSLLGIPEGTPVITRDQVAYAKPNPDLFLLAAERLHVPPGDCFVVGDSIWDLLAAQRAGALGVGLLSGGYGSEELETAGAYRVYDDPADLLRHLDELGIRAG